MELHVCCLEKGLRQAQSAFSTDPVSFPELAHSTVAELAEATMFDSQKYSVHLNDDQFFY